MTVIGALIGALIGAVVIVAYIGAGVYAVVLGIDKEQPVKAIAIVVVLIALLILAVAKIAENSDNSVHCGPGTTYRESSRYDPATKQVRHDWVCEAN